MRAHEELHEILAHTPKWHLRKECFFADIQGTHIVDFGEAHGTIGAGCGCGWATTQAGSDRGRSLFGIDFCETPPVPTNASHTSMACRCVGGGDEKRVQAEIRKLRADAHDSVFNLIFFRSKLFRLQKKTKKLPVNRRIFRFQNFEFLFSKKMEIF